MIAFPGAKINIGLRITSRRNDGYHDIQTIFYPVVLCDILEFVVPSSSYECDKLTVTGFNTGMVSENLVIKALETMREQHHIPYLDIHLHKAIPPGAGLGGGSSDAAVFIKMLNSFFNLSLSNEDMKKRALSIGSDVPFFIDNVPAYAEGRGEILSPLDQLPAGYYLVIVSPGINVSTRKAYMNCKPEKRDSSLPAYYRQGISVWREFIENDFEKIVFPEYPLLGEIKELLYRNGALYSSMSGSGSSVYGIFSEKPVLPPSVLKYMVYSGPMQAVQLQSGQLP